jgi:hypothetical protein
VKRMKRRKGYDRYCHCLGNIEQVGLVVSLKVCIHVLLKTSAVMTEACGDFPRSLQANARMVP